MSTGRDSDALLPIPVQPGVEEHESERQEVSPLRRIHHLLQGRYGWAITLAIVFGLIGGAAGYFVLQPSYRATALIQAKAHQDQIIWQLPELNRQDFDKWVAGLSQMVKSEPRVIEQVLDNPAVQQHVIPPDMRAEGALLLRENLTVIHDRGTNMIMVSYEDEDPQSAEIVTQAVVDSFMQIFGQRDIDKMAEKISTVAGLREEKRRAIEQKKQEITLNANKYGSDMLLPMYQRKLQDYQEYESKTRVTEAELAMRGIDPTLSMEEQLSLLQNNQDDTGSDLDARGWALRGEPKVKALLGQIENVQREIKSLEASGISSGHFQVKRLTSQTESLEAELDNYVADLNAMEARDPTTTQVRMVRTDDLAQLSDYQLIRRYASEKALRSLLEEETKSLGRERLKIDDLSAQASKLEEELDVIDHRLEQLRTELGGNAGRLEVATDAHALSSPINSGKRKQLAVAGLGGGAMFGFGIVLLIGLMDPRVRSTDEATSRLGSTRLLGVLPMLPEDLGDPASAAVVGYAVHHMRTLLQLGHRSASSPAFAVTGPATGSGKTSLTISLGMSFAATGARTLLIDSDLAGGGLSYRLEAVVRRRIGQILVDAGEITTQELQQALAAASASGQRLGESLINLGLLEPSRLSEILEMQTNTYVGLLDAINGEPVEGCVTQTDIDNLWVLPIGGALLDDMGRISPKAVRSVVQQAREQFDVVLIDTGPVPGSVETSMVAAEADQVVMIIARGDERNRVESAVGFLSSLGANLAGFVFNRAEQADLERSHLSSSLSSRSAAFSADQRPPAYEPNGRDHFGAVARAMISRRSGHPLTGDPADVVVDEPHQERRER